MLDASANRTLTLQNSDGTYLANLSVEGNVTVSGGEAFINPLSSSSSTSEGTLYYDSDDDNLYVYAKWRMGCTYGSRRLQYLQ